MKLSCNLSHPAHIKAEICIKIGSLTNLARLSNLHISTISAALKRLQKNGNWAIAKCLGKSPHELWPEWFDKHNNRIFSQHNVSRVATERESQKCMATPDMEDVA